MNYCIDTSALIDAWLRYYPKDILPDLWEKFEELIKDNKLIAPEEVFKELENQDDELTKWAKQNTKMFISIDEEIQESVRYILSEFPKLINVKKSKSMADPWVVALAKIKNAKVVTGENFAQAQSKTVDKANTVKIPDVCRVFNIHCFNIVGFCRDLKLVFHLK